MKKLDIIFQDDYIIVFDKPPGLVVTPTETQHTTTLSEILINDFQINLDRGGIVHRLDKDTSGLIIVAKTQEVLENLQVQFKSRGVKKEYVALVHGLMIEKEGVISGAIGRNPQNREKFIVTSDGKEAETGYKVISNFQFPISNFQSIFEEMNKIQLRKMERSNYGQFSLVRLFPKTGRTHQIRVHLKHIGFPIVGDEKYGGRKTVRLDHRWCQRQFLHAAKLEIDHPMSGKRMSFEVDLAQDLNQAISKLEPLEA